MHDCHPGKSNRRIRSGARRSLLLVACLFSGAIAAPASAQEALLGEIRMFAGNFAPRGWALCEGQLLPINQYSALFSILGTTYGGDGRTTFALPDLRGRGPLHPGTGPGLSTVRLGEKLGSETRTLTVAQLPPHTHSLVASDALATQEAPGDTSVLAAKNRTKLYASDTTLSTNAVPLSPSAIAPTGNGTPVSIRPPSLGLNYIIALTGTFPSRD